MLKRPSAFILPSSFLRFIVFTHLENKLFVMME